jgi:radical SAM protein with 4Fe4S-binding SPASM domain
MTETPVTQPAGTPRKSKMSVSQVSKRKRRRYWRALHMIRRNMTWKRLLNLVLVECERVLGRTRLRSKPYIITIDPTNYCNLRCPLCPTGSGDLGRARAILSLDEFERLVSQVSKYAFEISLMNWGEPLLNPHLFEMIRYCRSRRLSTSLSTNLVRLKPQDVDPLLTSGLDYVTVSLDGTTQEVYEIYRVGGKLDVVLDNLRTLLKRRDELGLQTPWIRWQFIIMKHNEHQIDEARQLAKEIGVDEVTFIPVGLPFWMSEQEQVALAKEWFAAQPQNRHWAPERPDRTRGGRCPYLYRTMTLNPGGGVAPCCIVYGEAYDYGNLLQQELDEVWNNPHYVSARAVQTGQGEGNVKTACHSCPLYARDKGILGGIRHLFSL